MWAAVSLGGLIGCSDALSPDGGASGGDESAGTSGDTTPNHDEGGTDEDQASTGQSEPPVETETSDPTDSDTGEPLGCDLDCGERGECVENEDGSLACQCADGDISIGLGCLPCATVEGKVDANVPKVDVVVTVLINDAEPPHSPVETGKLFLRNSTTGDEVYLGQTRDGTLTKTIVPGTYEVYYEHLEGGAEVPINSRALVDVRYFDDLEPITLNLPVMQISGDITVNGAVPPEAAVDWGRVALHNPTTGDRAPIGSSRNGGFVANVLPGSYEVRYEAREHAQTMPINEDAFLASIVVQEDRARRQTFDVDVPVVEVEGNIRINGSQPSQSPAERGRIVYVDRRTGEQIEVALTSDTDYAARLVAAEYDVFYQRISGGDQVPLNRWGFLDTFTLNSDGTRNINIHTGRLTGEFRVGDQPPPQDASDDGVLVLRNDHGDEVVLGNTAQQNFSAHVIDGDYSVYYSQQTAGAMLPANTNARISSLVVSGDASPVLDVSVATISGTLALSGEVPPDSVYDDGRVYLRNRETGDSALLGNTRMGSYTANVVPGSYDIVYEAEIADQFMPVNKAALIRENVKVSGGETIPVDIPVAGVMGQMLVDNQPVPASTGEIANLYLEDVVTGDLIWLGSANAPLFERPLATGRYLVRYQAQGAGEALPGNVDAPVACFDLVTPE